jgi:hypothetical protein
VKISPKIILLNQPRLSGHAADEKYDSRRAKLLPHIQELLSTNDLFSGKEAVVEFAHTGVSSLVCFITADGGKYVLKIPLTSNPAEGEARFLKEWEFVGVNVPHIFQEGKIDNHPYIIMSFVDAPILKGSLKDTESRENIYEEMGKTLRKMHESCAEGYGRLVNGQPQFKTFRQWVEGDDIGKMIDKVQELGLLTNDHGSLSKVIEILSAFCDKSGTTYCHWDFGSGNLLATTPFTVIDPHMLLNNGIIDLGRTIQLMIAGKAKPDLIKKLILGYYTNGTYNKQALHAAIVLSAYTKFPYWHKKGYTEQIENTKLYLVENRNLLEESI